MIKTYTLFKIVILVVLSPLIVQGQGWNTPLDVTFDPDDTVYQQSIIIDTTHNHNLWQIGKPNKVVFDSAYSLPNAIVTDTLNQYPPNDTSVFILGLRNFLRTSTWWHAVGYIYFHFQMDVDSGSRGIIEYSSDTGQTWKNLPTIAGTPPDTITFTHSSFGWQWYSIPFFDINSDTLLLRFTFISDSDAASGDGWQIDNFQVNYYTEDVSIVTKPQYSIFPNPANTLLTIKGPDKIGNVEVYNSSGKLLLTNYYNKTVADIDISSLLPGIYFVNVEGNVRHKFLKQ